MARGKFGDFYTYYPTESFKFKQKILINCPYHGDFSQIAKNHLSTGCPECSLEKSRERISESNLLRFITKANLVHGGLYDYSLTDQNSKTARILCSKHGEFKMLKKTHLAGWGCSKCSEHGSSLDRHLQAKDSFESRANKIHGSKYDYSQSVYKSSSEKLKIICPEHGEFWQTPLNHLQKHGCPYCSGRKIQVSTLESQMREFYGPDLKILNLSEITSSKSLICFQINGECRKISVKTFRSQQTNKVRASFHNYKVKSRYRTRVRTFIASSGSRYKSRLDFLGCDPQNFIKYLDYFSPLDDFQIDHKYPCDCFDLSNKDNQLVCFNYRNHQKLSSNDNLAKKNKILPQFSFYPSKIKNILELEAELRKHKSIETCFIQEFGYADIYVPSSKIAIRVYDAQECKKGVLKNDKFNFMLAGIDLIQVFAWELILKKNIVFSRIKSKLNLSQSKIHARKCQVKTINSRLKGDFLRESHIQGNDQATHSLGLFYNENLVSVMTFCKPRVALGKRKGSWELSRFCSLLNTQVIGGGSRLFKSFVKQYPNEKIISYSDCRWGRGDIYSVLGFSHVGRTDSNYYYYHDSDHLKTWHRFSFSKGALSSKLEIFNKEDTELENCEKNGYYRIYNSANDIYEFN